MITVPNTAIGSASALLVDVNEIVFCCEPMGCPGADDDRLLRLRDS